MKERDFQTKFNLWLKYNAVSSGAFELKICHEKSLPYAEVKPHQILNLQLAKHSKLIHKIADVGVLQKPFDSFVLMGVPAYVVVMFYMPGQKKFYMIDVDKWVEEVDNPASTRKSLTEERAKEIATICSLA